MLSVIIPTHNPRPDYLRDVLGALRGQTLSVEGWELVVVDNGSREPLCESLDLAWHPRARVVVEPELGLTHARLRGFAEATGDLIAMVDDDNVLAPDYLATAVGIAGAHAGLGALGGRCLPSYECTPPPWIDMASSGLGLRDLGPGVCVFPEGQEMKRPPGTVSVFPDCAPIGAGMVVRRAAADAYTARIRAGPVRVTDRRGDSLASAGDNDLCLTVLEEGWQVGYFPELSLQHLIPARRLKLSYHRRMAREAMRSFVLMLDGHRIRPWPAIPAWSVPLRVARDAWRVKPWRSPENSLRWCMNRGRYEACALLTRGSSA